MTARLMHARRVHPPTPCCRYLAAAHLAYPVGWNPAKRCVCCANCGATFQPVSASQLINHEGV